MPITRIYASRSTAQVTVVPRLHGWSHAVVWWLFDLPTHMMDVYSERHFFPCTENMVPRGLEPRTFRLLAERSNQLSYETTWKAGVAVG